MDCNENYNDIWEWQEEEHSLQRDSQNDISRYLWDEVNHDESSLLYMLDDQTPIKDCIDFGYHVSETGENINKALKECTESSQFKRRRMLQYDSDAVDITTGNGQSLPAIGTSKVQEEPNLDHGLVGDLCWAPGFSDDRSGLVHENLDQSSEEWLVNCFNKSDINSHSDEMISYGACDGQIDISEFCNVPNGMEPDTVPQVATPSSRIKFKGRKSYIQTPIKLATSVAYPFALIKPCGVQGDTTLNDINQRIHTPLSKSKYPKDDDSSFSYPTSAFSGKPVVAKTKIRTEGGKGSITIMRTKG